MNAGAGNVVDVLFVNGSAGGSRRRITLRRDEPFEITMAKPPAAARTARFGLFAWKGQPSEESLMSLPFGLGPSCMPMPPSGLDPAPRVVWNNTRDARLGRPDLPSAPAPSTVLARPGGTGRAVTFFLQGIIADPASAARIKASVTNGVVVRVQ